MTAVIQRVLSASIEIDGEVHSSIENGFLVLLGVSVDDTEEQAKQLADKTAKLRIFEDENEKMNLSLLDFQSCEKPYKVLVVSNFTLLANCRNGNRPEFLNAARPEKAKVLYEQFNTHLREKYDLPVFTGVFQADMKLNLINDGPVTIVLDTDKLK
jgi:D-tyrosyl-tRNA(Tyr) deacylase